MMLFAEIVVVSEAILKFIYTVLFKKIKLISKTVSEVKIVIYLLKS